MRDSRSVRVSLFILLLTVSAVIFRFPLHNWLRLSFTDDYYSYIGLIPVATAGLTLFKKTLIFRDVQYSPGLGFSLTALAFLLLYEASPKPELLTASYIRSITILAIMLIWIALFALFFGPQALRAATFPLALLLFAAPIPRFALNYLISWLQNSSAWISAMLFHALRVPAHRQGLIISLPGFDIEIAEQCSGIRSCIALTLVSVLAGYLYLRGTLNRLCVILVTIPVVIFKNALRIVTLSTLALYVDHGFLFGRLHRYGGLCFSLIDLGIVIPLLLILHKSEAIIGGPQPESSASRRAAA
jgi:exosortase